MSRKHILIALFVLIVCLSKDVAATEFNQWEPNPSEGDDVSTYFIYTQTGGAATQGNTVLCYLDSWWAGPEPASDYIEIQLRDANNFAFKSYTLSSTTRDGDKLLDTGAISKSIFLTSETRIDSVVVRLFAEGAKPRLNTTISSVTVEHNVVYFHVDSTEKAKGTDLGWDYIQTDGEVATAKGYVQSVSGWSQDEDSDLKLYNYRAFTTPSGWQNTAQIVVDFEYLGVYDSTSSGGVGLANAEYGFGIYAGVSWRTPGSGEYAKDWGITKVELVDEREEGFDVGETTVDAVILTAGLVNDISDAIALAMKVAKPTAKVLLPVFELFDLGWFLATEAPIDGAAEEENPICGAKTVAFFDVDLTPGETYTTFILLSAKTKATAYGLFAAAKSFIDFQYKGYGIFTWPYSDWNVNAQPRGLFLEDVLIVYRPTPRPMIKVHSPQVDLYCTEGDSINFKLEVYNGTSPYDVTLYVPDILYKNWTGVGENGVCEIGCEAVITSYETVTDCNFEILVYDKYDVCGYKKIPLHIIPKPRPVIDCEVQSKKSTHETLTFRWWPDEQDTITGYTFRISKGNIFDDSEPASVRYVDSEGNFTNLEGSSTQNTEMTSCQVYGLAPETTYYFWVVVQDGYGNSAYTDPATGTTCEYPDLNPVVLNEPVGEDITRNSIILSWSESDRALNAFYYYGRDYSFDHYEVRFCTWDPCSQSWEIIGTGPPVTWIHKEQFWEPGDEYYNHYVYEIDTRSTTRCQLRGLDANTPYHFIVGVFDKLDHNAFSNVIGITTKPPPESLEAEIGPSQTIFIDEDVTLTAQAFGGIPPYTFLWDFDKSNGVDWNEPDEWSFGVEAGECRQKVHHYSEYGRYEASLKVTDAEGNWVEPPDPNTWCFVSVRPHPPELWRGCHFWRVSPEERLVPSSEAYTVDPVCVLWDWNSGYPGDEYPTYHNFDSYRVRYKIAEQVDWPIWETITDPYQQMCSAALPDLMPDTWYDFQVEAKVTDYAGQVMVSRSDTLKILTDIERVDLAFYNMWVEGVQVVADGNCLWKDPNYSPLNIVKGYGESIEIKFQVKNYGEIAVEPYPSTLAPVSFYCFHHGWSEETEYGQEIGWTDVDGLVGLEPGQVSGVTVFRWQPSQIWMGPKNDLDGTVGQGFGMRGLAYEKYGAEDYFFIRFSLNLILDNTEPGLITDLEVTDTTPTSITLSWTSPLDYDDGGFNLDPNYLGFYEYIPPGGSIQRDIEPREKPIGYYDIRYSTELGDGAEWLYTNGTRHIYKPASHVGQETESCTIEGLEPGKVYYFIVNSFDQASNPAQDYSNIAEGITLDIVNFYDFAKLAYSWLAKSGQQNFDEKVDYFCDGIVDMNDLCILTGQWLQSAVLGPIAHWKLDGDANDSSNYGNHGTEIGSPTYADGVDIQAISLDGIDDYIDCGNAPIFDITNQITISAWIKVNTFDKNWQTIIAKGDDSWRLARDQDKNGLQFACNGLSTWVIRGSEDVNDGYWHHVAGVYDGSKIYLYVDGGLDIAQLSSGSIDISSHNVCIGENSQITGRYWNGFIDDVRIYNRALSAEEVKALFDSY